MISKIGRRMIVLIVAVIITLVLMTQVLNKTFSRDFRNRHQNFHSDLNLVDVLKLWPSNVSSLEFPCTKVRLQNISFPLCSYKQEEDVWVSGSFLSNRYWEQSMVEKVIRIVRSNKEIFFLDIGANIGAYSLPIAHMGHNVISVEPNPDTLLRLATSINMGRISDKVTLLQNAVSDTRTYLNLVTDKKNRGDTAGVQCINGTLCGSRTSVRTILLDDLSPLIASHTVVIKIDIQCAEIHAMNKSTSSRFFAENYVPLIVMEWECMRPSLQGPRSLRNYMETFIDYFISMNFTAHRTGSGEKLSKEQWMRMDDNDVAMLSNEMSAKLRTF